MRNWVEIEQSIPCFFASVTLGCYDKLKREREMGSSAWELGGAMRCRAESRGGANMYLSYRTHWHLLSLSLILAGK
jgi:hypothetical protein